MATTDKIKNASRDVGRRKSWGSGLQEKFFENWSSGYTNFKNGPMENSFFHSKISFRYKIDI
jgi:hypothetical protein